MTKTLPVRPRVSEKAYAISQTGTYVFIVPTDSNKVEIAKAVAAQFAVDVTSVNTVTQKGKPIRFYRKGRFDNGTRSDIKKAYIRIAEGQTIPVFAAEEPEEAAPAKKAKKGDK